MRLDTWTEEPGEGTEYLHVGRTSWPLLASRPLTLGQLCLPWVAAGVAHPPRPLGVGLQG